MTPYTLLYDGKCPFCTSQAVRLKRLAGKALVTKSFQDPKVLERFPEVTHEECMQEIKLVMPDRKVLGGAHAIFYSLSLNPFYRLLRWVYPLPLLKQILDWGYGMVARNRYKIEMKDCPSGTCSLKKP